MDVGLHWNYFKIKRKRFDVDEVRDECTRIMNDFEIQLNSSKTIINTKMCDLL